METTKPVIFLDLETTGTSTTADRIVQIAAMKTTDNFTNREPLRKYLVNPGQPISPDATAVHGITDEMVADKPMFGQLAKGLLSYLTGCDIAGYNILNFDVPLLAEEFARIGVVWDYSTTNFIDCYKIFADREKRDLSAAVKFYAGREHTDAHDAGEDVVATVDVLAGQLERYQDLREMSVNELNTFCRGARSVDLAGKIYLNDAGEPCFAFGKSINKRVKDDPGFANWMLKNDFTTDTKNVIKKILGYA